MKEQEKVTVGVGRVFGCVWMGDDDLACVVGGSELSVLSGAILSECVYVLLWSGFRFGSRVAVGFLSTR